MKFFIKCVGIASLSGLIPWGLMKSGAQTTNGPADYSAKTVMNDGTSQIPGNGTTTHPVSKSQTDVPDAPQPRAHKTMPASFFGQSAPGFSGMTLVDNPTSIAAPHGVTSLRPELDPARKSSGNYLALPIFRGLSPTKSSIRSFVRPTGKLNFKLFHSLVQTETEDQPLQIEGASTRAWTTIIGRNPCKSTFADARIYEPQFDLFWAGAAPQR